MVTGTISIDGGPPQPCVVTGVVSPLGTWGGVAPPYPDISPPTDQPRPEHPIVIVPPGAIDGVHPEHPIFLPVYPTHPIELPPEMPAAPGFQWVYVEPYGWVLDPLGGGKPLPPGRR
jgi:hypothetical protein